MNTILESNTIINNSFPLVSICISAWNRRDGVKRLLESIVLQDYPSIEVCIVDNASLDNTNSLYKEYSDKLKIRYMLLPEPDKNAIKTINLALNLGIGEYLLVMDDDSYLSTTDVVSKLVKVMEDNPRAAIVGANVKGEDLHYQMPVRNIDGEYLPDDIIDSLGVFHYCEFHGACAMFRKNFTNLYGFYDESFVIYMNELDMALRYISRGYHVLIDSSAVAIHAGVGGINACNGRAKYFIKNYNTCIIRNFRGSLRWKSLVLHSIMSCGYYVERILMWNMCPKYKVLPLIASFIPVLTSSLFELYTTEPRQHEDKDRLDIIEQSYYNGFRRCITDRFTWLAFKRGINRGIK